MTYLTRSRVCTVPASQRSRRAERNEQEAGRTRLPATPPAMRANPTKRKALARHATLPPLYESSSPMSRALSIRLTMIMPSVAHRPGAQSAKVTWTGTGSNGESSGFEMGLACAERTLASRKAHQPKANCVWEREEEEAGGRRWGEEGQLRFKPRGEEAGSTHQCSCKVDEELSLARAQRRQLEPARARDEEDAAGVAPAQRDAARGLEGRHCRCWWRLLCAASVCAVLESVSKWG